MRPDSFREMMRRLQIYCVSKTSVDIGLASAYVAAKGIRQAAATDGDITWVADNSAHPTAGGSVFAFLSIFVLASLPSSPVSLS